MTGHFNLLKQKQNVTFGETMMRRILNIFARRLNGSNVGLKFSSSKQPWDFFTKAIIYSLNDRGHHFKEKILDTIGNLVIILTTVFICLHLAYCIGWLPENKTMEDADLEGMTGCDNLTTVHKLKENLKRLLEHS